MWYRLDTILSISEGFPHWMHQYVHKRKRNCLVILLTLDHSFSFAYYYNEDVNKRTELISLRFNRVMNFSKTT